MCVPVHASVCTCMCECMHAHVCAHTHACLYASVYMSVLVHMYLWVHPCIHVSMHMYACAYVSVCICVWVCLCVCVSVIPIPWWWQFIHFLTEYLCFLFSICMARFYIWKHLSIGTASSIISISGSSGNNNFIRRKKTMFKVNNGEQAHRKHSVNLIVV